MKNTQRITHWSVGLFAATLALFLFTGCESTTSSNGVSTAQPAPAPTPVVAPAAQPAAAPAAQPAVAAAPAATAAAAPSATKTVLPPVRIKAGGSDSFKDADGNTWLPDQGFTDGETADRPDVQITGTKSPAIYRGERYSMTSFTYSVPNGKYTVKLHFCETYEGITDKGQRVFSFSVQGHETKDLDVFDKAGGAMHAYIVTVPVEVTNGKVDITFTPNVENPEINGIEILPNP
jgi:hypothetical protein